MWRQADLVGADPYPASEPQAASDLARAKPDYTLMTEKAPDEWQFVMTATHVSVSPSSHGEQFDGMAHNDFDQPHAYGKLVLHYRWDAEWHVVYSNMSMHLVEKKLKRYTNEQGWNWTGLCDDQGMPMDYQSLNTKMGSVPGIGEINPGLKNWKLDEWSGMGQFDNPADHDVPFYGISDPPKEMAMTSPRTCSECGELMLNYDAWRKHILREHVNPDRRPPDSPQPVVDLDDVLPAGFNEAIMDKTVQRQSRLIFQLAAGQQQMIPDPMLDYLPASGEAGQKIWVREGLVVHEYEWQDHIAMGLRGDLPKGMTIQVFEGEPTNWIAYADLDGQRIGELDTWGTELPGGVKAQGILSVWTHPDYRRMGVATALRNAVEKQLGVTLLHAPDLTEDGAGWAYGDPESGEVFDDPFFEDDDRYE